MIYATNVEYMDNLTKRQREVFAFLQGFLEEKGYPPTIREIGAHFGFGPRASKEHLDLLEKKGYIRRGRGARMIEITPQARNHLQGIPVVGRVAAGVPLLAIENIEGFLKVDVDISGDREVFFLRVKGESMIGYGIKDGDYVLVQPGKTASEGEILVFRIHDEATVKEYRRKGESVLLVPHNPEFQILECSPKEDFEILGKVIGLWRKM